MISSSKKALQKTIPARKSKKTPFKTCQKPCTTISTQKWKKSVAYVCLCLLKGCLEICQSHFRTFITGDLTSADMSFLTIGYTALKNRLTIYVVISRVTPPENYISKYSLA